MSKKSLMFEQENIFTIFVTPEGKVLKHNRPNSIFNKILLDNLIAIPANSKKLILNLLDKNYMVLKIAVNIGSKEYFQFIFEEWRINHLNNDGIIFSIKDDLKNIHKFKDTQQEVIYALLNGFIEDKEISIFLSRWKDVSPRNIRYTMSFLFEEFETNSRKILVQKLKAHNLDYFIPRSLYKPGIYEFTKNKINLRNDNNNYRNNSRCAIMN